MRRGGGEGWTEGGEGEGEEEGEEEDTSKIRCTQRQWSTVDWRLVEHIAVW